MCTAMDRKLIKLIACRSTSAFLECPCSCRLGGGDRPPTQRPTTLARVPPRALRTTGRNSKAPLQTCSTRAHMPCSEEKQRKLCVCIDPRAHNLLGSYRVDGRSPQQGSPHAPSGTRLAAQATSRVWAPSSLHICTFTKGKDPGLRQDRRMTCRTVRGGRAQQQCCS